ncbi:MAG: CRISPR-associated helicase Cas3' [Firmicutes bacterium]|nr:CRISPR-associated helicase Cas3' [Bacillota bacterium]
MHFYAHSSAVPGKPWQKLSEHLSNTAKRAEQFASEFHAGDFGYICGALHDIGKYSPEFQERLRGARFPVDHSTAGAIEAKVLFGESFGKLLAYCIAGHHSGLPDYGTHASTEGTLCSRFNKQVKDYSSYRLDIGSQIEKLQPTFPLNPMQDYVGFSISFFVRMLYSCLVDADFLDTESYMSEVVKPRGNNTSIVDLHATLSSFLRGFVNRSTKINIKRCEILDRSLTMAEQEQGLYSLTVPTGGGKTYSSLAFALKHAVEHKLNRVIYVIPYTSIIEQNAKVFKDTLGEHNILEHHSNYQFQERLTEDYKTIDAKLKLATENWDIPIVVTTNVQFFESLFSNRSSRCRKLHNMSRSVIIFDEAQMLPLSYLKPCLLAVTELVRNYGSTAVLCTATQPSIRGLLPSGMQPVEIMDNPQQLYQDFKKVQVVKEGKVSDDSLVENLNKLKQVLCIVNTRKHAKELFAKLEDKENSFHLSTLMCSIHRQQTIAIIRQRLRNQQPCRVISTQLIEAGVDVDFPVVYRALAGIDSIVQSAGRCNREGHLRTGYLHVFEPDSNYSKLRGYLERTAKVAEEVFRHYDDPISLEAIEFYFKQLYMLEGESLLDKKGIIECFEARHTQLEFDFQTAARDFRLIESNTVSVIVPFNNQADRLINAAKYTPYPLSLARKLQAFTLSIYEHEYKKLLKNSSLQTVNDTFVILKDLEGNYNKKTGLTVPMETFGEGIFI